MVSSVLILRIHSSTTEFQRTSLRPLCVLNLLLVETAVQASPPIHADGIAQNSILRVDENFRVLHLYSFSFLFVSVIARESLLCSTCPYLIRQSQNPRYNSL